MLLSPGTLARVILQDACAVGIYSPRATYFKLGECVIVVNNTHGVFYEVLSRYGHHELHRDNLSRIKFCVNKTNVR